jgi:hypothetical protein
MSRSPSQNTQIKVNEDFPRELGVLRPEGEKSISNNSSTFAVPLALKGRFYGSVFACVS